MKSVLFVLLPLALLLNSCAKENLSESLLSSPNTTAITTAPLALGNDCPPISDYECPNDIFLLLDQLVGPDNGLQTSGLLDNRLNCDPYSEVFCERECEEVIVTHAYAENQGWIAAWKAFEVPCENGVFSAASQEAFLQMVQQLAIDYAPECNGEKMEVKSYDLYWDTISFTYFYIGVDITYQAKCTETGGDGRLEPDDL